PYALSGFGVGFVVGLTGVGGGSLMTPALRIPSRYGSWHRSAVRLGDQDLRNCGPSHRTDGRVARSGLAGRVMSGPAPEPLPDTGHPGGDELLVIPGYPPQLRCRRPRPGSALSATDRRSLPSNATKRRPTLSRSRPVPPAPGHHKPARLEPLPSCA